jgi:hypothetical protein
MRPSLKLPVCTLAVLFTLIAALHTCRADWIYLVPSYDYFGYRDSSGVLHAWQADGARYNNNTRVYQVQINGRWLSVGEDIFQLTD